MEKSTFVIDIDGTICYADPIPGTDRYDYANAKPIADVVKKIQSYYEHGHVIILQTSRGMRTYGGDVEKIAAEVLPVLERWLSNHEVPYHELHIGKPWGPNVYYIDDRSLSPAFFAMNDIEDYEELIDKRSHAV